MHRVDLDARLARELKALPAPRAPHTLLPRVRAAVQAWQQRPWYSREWLTWPLAWRIASVAALMVLFVGGGLLSERFCVHGPGPAASMNLVASSIVSGWQWFEIAVRTARLLWDALVQPLVPYAFALTLLMCLACVACGTALNQIALGKVVRR
jgi:hypothetical protein